MNGSVAVPVTLILAALLLAAGLVLWKRKARWWALLCIGIAVAVLVATPTGHKIWSAIQGGYHGMLNGWNEG